MEIPFLGHLELRADYRQEDRPTVMASQAVSDEYAHIVAGLQRELDAVVKPAS
jgi:hypothetical protein